MTPDRDRTAGILLGLAVFAFLPHTTSAAEIQRLPPVEQPATGGAGPVAPAAHPRFTPRDVTQSVWLPGDPDPTQRVSSDGKREVQLVTFDEESYLPPVQVEMDQPAERASSTTAPAHRTVTHPYLKLASQTDAVRAAPVPTADPVTRPTPVAENPSASELDQLAKPAIDSAEMIERGSPFVDDAWEAMDGCGCYACPAPVCWSLRGEALMLFRSDTRRIKFVEHGTGAAVRGQRPALLTTDDLDPNPAWGPRITLTRRLTDTHNLELVWFGLHNWHSQAAFNGINGVGFSFNNIDVPFDANITSDFDGAQYISGDYASKIQNVEANLVTNNRWDMNMSTGFPWYHYADFLMGFRYFRLSEEFDLRSTDAGETSDYLIDTLNDLVGGQVGVVFGTYHSPRLSWSLASKAGVYANFARQSTLMRDDDNTVLFRDFTTEGEQIAFVGDTNFNLAYDISSNVQATFGYYLLYVGGVALAPEQLDFTTTPTSGSGLNQNGGAFYHGPSVGLNITY